VAGAVGGEQPHQKGARPQTLQAFGRWRLYTQHPINLFPGQALLRPQLGPDGQKIVIPEPSRRTGPLLHLHAHALAQQAPHGFGRGGHPLFTGGVLPRHQKSHQGST
jgi:hypothetical protein